MGVNSTCWRDKKQKGKKYNIILDTIFGWLGSLLQPLLFLLLLNSNPPPPYLPLDSCAVVVVVVCSISSGANRNFWDSRRRTRKVFFFFKKKEAGPFGVGGIDKCVLTRRRRRKKSFFSACLNSLLRMMMIIFPPHPKNGRWSGRECTGVIVQCKVYIRYMAAGQFLFKKKKITWQTLLER